MSTLELLPVVMKIEDEHVLVLLIYRPPGPIGTFIEQLRIELGFLPTDKYRTLILGDFNLDQNLAENEQILFPLLTDFKLIFCYSHRFVILVSLCEFIENIES